MNKADQMSQADQVALVDQAGADVANAMLTPRHREILENALQLLVSGGDKELTTAKLAAASNCSKQTLYKWFGDRNGILAAMMEYQGSKVGEAIGEVQLESAAAFKSYLTGFAVELLTVLSGDMSLALNRLAIGQAGSSASAEGAELGQLLIQNGRGVIRQKGIGFLNSAKTKQYLRFEHAEEAYQTFYGLIVSDFHVRILLGEACDFQPSTFERKAALAVAQFYTLYGPDGPSTNI